MNLPNTSTNAHGTATTLMYEGTPHTYVVTHSPRPCLRPTALTTTTLEAYTKAKAEALNGSTTLTLPLALLRFQSRRLAVCRSSLGGDA